MLRSASDYRLQERKIAEAWCEAFHVPTRTEMDEMQRTVTELRRQLRALQRARTRRSRCEPTRHATPARKRARLPRRRTPPHLRNHHDRTAKKTAAAQALAEFSDFNLKMARGQQMLQPPQGRGRPDRDRRQGSGVPPGQGRRCTATRPTAKRTLGVPVLVAYGQIGRYTMTDLQEDRSMLRNLLALGVDVYAVDWGSPTRSDRWLTFEDYVDDYLNECVEFICREHGMPGDQSAGHLRRRRLLAVLRGALPGAREEPDPDDHAGGLPPGPGRRALNHGFINLWTRGLSDEDIDRLIEANGNLPGRADELRVRADDAGRDAVQVQRRPARHVRRREEAAQLPAHGEVDRGSPAPPRRGGQAAAHQPLQEQRAGPRRVPARRPHGRSARHQGAGAERLREGRPHHPAEDDPGAARRRRQQGLHARSAWTAATSASSSAASRRACSARASTTGFASATETPGT